MQVPHTASLYVHVSSPTLAGHVPCPTSRPGIQELQDTGRSQGLFASLGKSITRACHTSKAEGAARALQRRLSARGLGGSRREGVHATAGNHLREGLFSHLRGAELRQAALVSHGPCMALLRQGVASVWAQGRGAPRRGAQDGAWSSYSSHRRGSVSVCGHECASED